MTRNESWQSEAEFFKQPLPAHLDAWLQHPRLTQSLKKHFTHQIELISQNFTQLTAEEAAILNLRPQSNCWLREISHKGNDNYLVYARSVVPEATYQRFANEFNALGNHAIGDTLLFKDPTIARSEFRYCTITTKHSLYQRITEVLGEAPHFYARCSTFHWQEFPLLITEIYSPDYQRWSYT